MAIPPPDLSAQVEDRIRRLEAALRGLEELQRQSGRAPEAGILPTEGASVKGPTLLGRAAALLGSLAPLARAVVIDPSPVSDAARPPRPWFLLDALADARAMVRMYADPRHRLTWMGRVVPPLFLFAFLTVHLWLPYLLPCIGWLLFQIPGLQWALEKAVELLLAYLLFRALGQEARRYRETAPDLPPSLRL